MKKVAIIPARGGSKRIPRKNIKPFLDKPIIAYSIEAAIQSSLFDEVMVSTDDEEIASIAQKFGAQVPFIRSNKNADDYATTVDVLIEVLNAYQEKGQVFDYGCCLYPTAPFVDANLLLKGFSLLKEKNRDTVFPVLPFSFPIQRAIKIKDDHSIALFQPEHLHTRSQDLERSYHDAGQFYWFKMEPFLEKRKLWTDNTEVIVIDELKAQDIDHPIDWAMAELKYKLAFHEEK